MSAPYYSSVLTNEQLCSNYRYFEQQHFNWLSQVWSGQPYRWY